MLLLQNFAQNIYMFANNLMLPWRNIRNEMELSPSKTLILEDRRAIPRTNRAQQQFTKMWFLSDYLYLPKAITSIAYYVYLIIKRNLITIANLTIPILRFSDGWSMNHRYFKMGAVPISDTARYADTPRYGPIRVSGSIEKLWFKNKRFNSRYSVRYFPILHPILLDQ